MKVPYKWLLDYVDIDKDINEVGDALTLSGSKVEEIIETGKEVNKVVTGKILKLEKHPDADKLTICQVDVGAETIQIVTAATNMKENDVVPVALHGSTLADGTKIKKGKLRGVESNGMFCSEEELGLAKEGTVHGLMILPSDTPLGVEAKELLGISGGVIDFEITSNRADCFSVYGIAREAAATYGLPLKKVETSFKEDGDNINNYLKVEVKDDLCRRYAARMIKNVKIKESPDWIKQRLEEAGVRPINNIVDITNYVMLELGQPLHAFDYRDIEDKKIVVRRAEDGENFVTLDEAERKLDSSMLVIADGKRAVAVAGVMGGLNSEVKDDTTTVVFECANFNGANVRITSKKLGLRTESSSRFEKDLDPNLVEETLGRVLNLVEKLEAGDVVGGVIDIYPEPVKPHNIEVSPEWINGFLGIDIEGKRMKEILESLEMKVAGEDILKIEVPTFRQDVKIKQDVAEEVVRIYGYDVIPSIRIVGEAVEAAWTREQKLLKAVKNTMVSCGLSEAMTYSFVSPKTFDDIEVPQDSELRRVVTISNPLGEDFSIMRTTAIPSMMECLSKNYKRDNKEAYLFDVARVYIPGDEKLPNEIDKLVIGMYGDADFYILKGIVEDLLLSLGIEKYDIERESANPTFHPGRTARLMIRRKDAGVFGEIHPNVLENYGIEDRVYVAELNLSLIFEASKLERKYKTLPKFPAVTRDIAMLVKDEVTVGEIENIIMRSGKELIESVKLFDVYKGKQIPDGTKSVAYSLSYRAADRTLKDAEVNAVHDKIVKNLSEKLGAQLR